MMHLRSFNRNLKPLWIPVAILGSLLLLSLVVQLGLAWTSRERILPVDRHVTYLERLQRNLTRMENALASQLDSGEHPLSPQDWQDLHDSLQRLLSQSNHLAASTPDHVRQAQRLLDRQSTHPADSLPEIQRILRTVFVDETGVHQQLTHNILDAANFQLDLGAIILLVLPASAMILLILMRRRIFTPLQQMGYLMEALGRREYQTIRRSRIDPMFQPLFTNYNRMVMRLSELEQEHQQRNRWLEEQVDTVTRALLEQQQVLANSERLAALGEMNARLAHELRNPLAGIQLALSNLQQEMSDDHQAEAYQERVVLVARETERVIRLLNSLLEQARHEPVALQELDLAATVQELLALARFQMPPHIVLEQQIPPDLICRLPDIPLRQALLNLILNARQAMAEQAGTIRITAERRAGELVLQVCDEGPGFPAAMLGDSIRPFRTGRRTGTGLGLSMVDRFARNQGGRLEWYNREPQGACVTLLLECGIRQDHG